MELTLFAHFGMNTFSGSEWGDGKESPQRFNPTRFDAAQWAAVAKDAGFGMIVLTAKHHDGFCLWPSGQTGHSVRSSPWRDGRGDVVKDVSDACRAAGLRFGVYLSPWDRNCPAYGDSPRYNALYLAQLRELLTNYGPIAEVWFDGACGEGPDGRRQTYDWAAYHALVRALQPDAVMFSDAGPDVRWIGNERGLAGDPCWAMVDTAHIKGIGSDDPGHIAQLQHGSETGDVWRPGECDVSIRPGWFWHPHEDAQLKTVAALMEIYLASVGRGCNLLLNVPPTTEGLIADADAARLREFRAARERVFGAALEANRTARPDGAIELKLDRPSRVRAISIREPIELGQRIRSFRVEAFDPGGSGPTDVLCRGTTVGHRRLIVLETPRDVSAVRLVIESSRVARSPVSAFDVY
jgi:alpha-L-fucosidase